MYKAAAIAINAILYRILLVCLLFYPVLIFFMAKLSFDIYECVTVSMLYAAEIFLILNIANAARGSIRVQLLRKIGASDYSELNVKEDERDLFKDRISKLYNYNLLNFNDQGVSKKRGIIGFVNTVFIILQKLYGKSFAPESSAQNE